MAGFHGGKVTDKSGDMELNKTGSNSTCPPRSHSPIRIKNNSYFVVIKTPIKKDLSNVCGVCKIILPGIKQSQNSVR